MPSIKWYSCLIGVSPNGLHVESLATRNGQSKIACFQVDDAKQIGSKQCDRFNLGMA